MARTAFPDNIGFSSILGYETMVVKLKVVANYTLVFSRGTMLRIERTVTKCKI